VLAMGYRIFMTWVANNEEPDALPTKNE